MQIRRGTDRCETNLFGEQFHSMHCRLGEPENDKRVVHGKVTADGWFE
jgi:hypothetical protein